ncbi:hypothetical protein NHQ30_009978 [Ciborinia camelliae]|nr:hypothetical protein NHQ30_009978 [Ciborinia camelliae]
MFFTDSAAMKSEDSSGIKQEAADELVDLTPARVPRGSHTMFATWSSSPTSSTAASGVKRKASSDISDETFAVPPSQRHHPKPTLPDLPKFRYMLGADDFELSPDLVHGSTPNSGDEGGMVSERIETLNSDKTKRLASNNRFRQSRQKPTYESYLQMAAGPKVELLVGPERKSFKLPKELLSHYSPVFDRCFEGQFREGQTQIMELPNDTVDDIEVLIEYILYNTVADALSITNCGKKTVERCISFFLFADKYDLGDVSTLIYSALRPALIKYGEGCFKEQYIEDVFNLTEDGNCLRELVVDAAISLESIKIIEGIKLKPKAVQAIAKKVEGFTEALFYRFMEHSRFTILLDPFTLKERSISCYS